MIDDKKVGIALGGGATLGAAHIGVLRAIEEKNIVVEYISGTSIGSLIASLYAFDLGVDKIEEIALNLKWLDITNIALSKYGLLSNNKIEKLIFKHIESSNIEDSKIPLSMIATDITNGEKVVLSQGNIAKAVMASTCVPGVFKPVELDDKLLVDGGIVENVPVKTVKEMGAEFVIGVDLNPVHSHGKPSNIVDVILNSFHYSIKQTVATHLKDSDVICRPDLSQYSLSSTKNTKSLIQKGYDDAITHLNSLGF